MQGLFYPHLLTFSSPAIHYENSPEFSPPISFADGIAKCVELARKVTEISRLLSTIVIAGGAGVIPGLGEAVEQR